MDATCYIATVKALMAIAIQANLSNTEQAVAWQHPDDESSRVGVIGPLVEALRHLGAGLVWDHWCATGDIEDKIIRRCLAHREFVNLLEGVLGDDY